MTMRGTAPDRIAFAWREARVDGVDAAIVAREAQQALEGLGYKPREAKAAVDAARPHVGAAPSLDTMIRAALRCAGGDAARAASSEGRGGAGRDG